MDDSFDELNITCALNPDSLSELINLNEKNKTQENMKNEEWKSKYYELEKLKGDLLSSDFLTLENFKLLKDQAVSKDGFLTNELRRIFWRKILSIEMTKASDHYEFIFTKESEIDDSEFYKIKEPFDIKTENSYNNIILADVRRSKVNRIFNKTAGFNDTNITLRKTLRKFINIMVTINNKEYHYYQSYHDIGLYFLMLYINNFETGINVFQRFSEFYLKQNLLRDQKKISEGFDFVKISDIIIEIIKNLSKEVYDILDVRVDFVFPWIVALYTHNIMESSIIYRIFDFFITHHPLAVYYLTANILIDEVIKIKARNSKYLENEDFFEYFQEINMEIIDYDYYIRKTVKSMSEIFPVKNLITVLKDKFNFDTRLPIMKEEGLAELLITKIEKEKISLSSPFHNWWILAPTISIVLLAIFFKKKIND